MSKDPKRWQEVIISSPFASLTKRDVYDYYSNPAIRDKILQAVRETGSGETILRQNFDPQRIVLRRKDHKGNFINLRGKRDFDAWNQMRMTEVHPVFGGKTNILLADIDPGRKVSWRRVKSIAETIAKTMMSDDSVKNVGVQFSGDRGFYVKGLLGKKIDVNEARKKVRQLVQGISQRPDVTLAKAKIDQIRIDTTPLKNRGSIKAPYSLSARTGLIAAPVKLEDLPKVQRADFKINKIKMAAKKKEFAPGIPLSRVIKPIPAVSNKTWILSIQRHNAQKAGKHYDVRFVDPRAGVAHSFAVPRSRLPTKKDRMLLAIQQPTHTSDYALHFEGDIPSGTYGAGNVKIKMQEPVEIIRANANQINFKRKNGQRFVLFRTQGNNWGFKVKNNRTLGNISNLT